MVFRRITALALATLILSVPVAALAQTTSYSQIVVTTILAPGVSAPSVAPIVTIEATNPSMAGIFNNNGPTISYASSFNNDTRTVTFIPGSYTVKATTNASGYYFYYAGDCSGFTPLSGKIVGCSITLSTTPPVSTTTCLGGVTWYGSSNCTALPVPYQGSNAPSVLSCSPNYQTINAGQPATFLASGGTPGGYNWTTPNRTSLNVGPSFTTVFQNTGVQTVMVQNGVQNVSCTVNVVSNGAVPITYPGIPSIISNYIPALPNTGFGPADSAIVAFMFALLIGAGIYATPYVRKALAVALG